MRGARAREHALRASGTFVRAYRFACLPSPPRFAEEVASQH
jgi:hypothetical protein